MPGKNQADLEPADSERVSPWLFIAVGLIAAIAVVYGAVWLYRRQTSIERQREIEALDTIAELKSAQIAAWRMERLNDVGVTSSAVFRQGVLAWVREGADKAEAVALLDTMDAVRRHYRYQNIVLTDPAGDVLLTVDPRLNSDGCAYTQEMAVHAVRAGQPVFGEIFSCRFCRQLHLDVAAPISDAHGDPVAVLLLRSDPDKHLLPVVTMWPTPRHSGHSLLVRREGDEVVVLNPVPGLAETALSLRLPFESGIGPAVAAARGQTGIYEGPNSRGIPVVAALRPIPDSTWALSAVVERDDLLAGVYRMGRGIGLVAVALLVAIGMALTALYKHAGKRAATARYEVEKARRESLEEFRTTLYSIGDGVIVTDARGYVRRMNGVAEQLTGWPENEAAGRPVTTVFCIIQEGTRTTVDDPVARVLREGAVVGLANHTLLLTRNGGERPIADSAAPVRDASGAMVGVVLVFRDQTREREAQEALIREHQNMEAILAAAPVGMMVFDPHEQVVEANAAAEHMLGCRLEELKRRRCGDLIGCVNRADHPDGCGRGPACPDCALFGAIRMVLNGGDSVFDRETSAETDGQGGRRKMTFRFSVAAVQLEGSRHAVVALEDVSEQRLLEAQLQQAQKMESVGRLAGGVAHDFNNMLEVILGHAELAEDQVEDGSVLKQDLQEIIKAARRSADLTRQLLAFARRQTVSPRPLDLNSTVAGMLNMLRRLIGEHIQLQWRPGRDLGTVEMDPAQVDQILANLLVNARDAIDGTGEVVIETRGVTPEEIAEAMPTGESGVEDYVLLQVSDSGRGMPEPVLEKIFEPFFTTKELGEGTGLGLATVYGIVRQNGGFIRVRSVPGEGSRFMIYLPRHSADPVQQAEEKKPLPARGLETVLIVEDEPAILQVGRRTLERYGYSVLTASTPDEALRRMDDYGKRVDLLLTDLIMPGMNGRELSHEAQRRYPGLRVLYMSGYTANVIVHQGVLEAGLDFLQKPFSARALATKVREVLDAREESAVSL